jgi:hypothetical protein
MKRTNGHTRSNVTQLPQVQAAPQPNVPSLEALKAGKVKFEWDGVRALGRYLIGIRVDVGGSTTAAGVIIPDALQMPAWVALSVGPDVPNVKQWDRILMIVKPPETVFLNHKGHDFCIVPNELLCCVLPMPDPDSVSRLVNVSGLNMGAMQ